MNALDHYDGAVWAYSMCVRVCLDHYQDPKEMYADLGTNAESQHSLEATAVLLWLGY